MPRARSHLVIVGVGFTAGLLSGLLGVGGGVIIVPGLILFAGMGQRRAHATSLAAILPIGSLGAALFAANGSVNYALFGPLAAGAVLGAPLGVRALSRVPEPALRTLFALTALVAGARLLVSP